MELVNQYSNADKLELPALQMQLDKIADKVKDKVRQELFPSLRPRCPYAKLVQQGGEGFYVQCNVQLQPVSLDSPQRI